VWIVSGSTSSPPSSNDALPLSERIEERFRRRLDALPADTRVLCLVAAADPVGDPVLVSDRARCSPAATTPTACTGSCGDGT
jgi:hypothetical protein